MSSILKALKKLEDEKLERQTEYINLSTAILKPRTPQSGMQKWLWGGGIALLATLITLSSLYIGNKSSKESSPPHQVSLPAPEAIEKPAPPLRSTGLTPAPALDARVQPPKSNSSPDEITSSLPPQQRQLKASQENTVRTEHPASDSVELTLSGIAWNKDSADRLAVINGQPASIGSSVNGALVEEILHDKVRMNLAGRKFDLFLGRQTKTN
jgi:general secretion pathway protein B